MTLFFVVCADADGAILSTGTLPDAALLAAQAQAGSTAYEVPAGFWAHPYPNMTALRQWLRDKVDAEAGAFRRLYYTDIPGQSQIYAAKEAEARAWTSGLDPALTPYLSAEAQLRGVAIAQVRAEVLAQVAAVTPLSALVEARRVTMKQTISAATTVPAAWAAATFDWTIETLTGSAG